HWLDPPWFPGARRTGRVAGGDRHAPGHARGAAGQGNRGATPGGSLVRGAKRVSGAGLTAAARRDAEWRRGCCPARHLAVPRDVAVGRRWSVTLAVVGTLELGRAGNGSAARCGRRDTLSRSAPPKVLLTSSRLGNCLPMPCIASCTPPRHPAGCGPPEASHGAGCQCESRCWWVWQDC